MRRFNDNQRHRDMATSTIPKRALTASTTLYSTSSPVEQDGTTYLQLSERINPYPLLIMVLFVNGTTSDKRAVLVFNSGTIGIGPWYSVGCPTGTGAVKLNANGTDTSQLRITSHTFTKVWVSAIYGLY